MENFNALKNNIEKSEEVPLVLNEIECKEDFTEDTTKIVNPYATINPETNASISTTNADVISIGNAIGTAIATSLSSLLTKPTKKQSSGTITTGETKTSYTINKHVIRHTH